MFGKRNNKQPVENTVAAAVETPDLEVPKEAPVEEPKTVGIQGFTEDKPAEAPAQAPAPVAQPKPEVPKEQYQIVGVEASPTEGIYIYKIVTNKYLGELGGVYEA